MADRDTLADAKERFKLAHDAESMNRQWAIDDLRFARLGEQWPERVRKDREAEGRPCLTINRLPAFVRQVVNDARQNKPAIRVRPADSSADPKTAEIYNGLIRNIESVSNADVAYDTALESAVYGGFGYFRIDVDYAHDDTFDLDIVIRRIANPFTVYSDPQSTAADASDWRYGFVTDLLPVDEFKRQYKGADQADWSADGDDKDELWRSEDSVRIAEYWERDEYSKPIVLLSSGQIIDGKLYQQHQDLWIAQGVTVQGERSARCYKVKHRVMTGGEILETNEWSGQHIPIVPVYGEEINIEGRRYWKSMVRDMRDPQTMFNFWRTASTELVALAPKAPFIGPRGSFDSDMGKWQTAHAKSHPFIEYDGPIAPARQPFAGVPAGALQEALNASDDLKSISGIHDASLGARSNETSGRAIMARQREGDVSTFHYIDNLSRAIRYGGRVIIDLIPHIYSKPRILRVLGEDGEPATVAVNGAPPADPTAQVYELSRGKYDLVVETGPSFTSKRDEAAAMLTEVMRASPAATPLLMDVLARNMDFPESDTIARRFKAMLPPQIMAMEGEGKAPPPEMLAGQLAQAQQQMQQMGQALQQAQMAAQSKAQEVASERQLAEQRLMLEREKNEAQLQLEKYRADMEIRLEREVAQMKAAASLEAEQIKAQARMQADMARAQMDASRPQIITTGGV
jgi:hypothetical protein